MENFFNFKIKPADGLGFGCGSAAHGVFILLCASAAALFCRIYVKCSAAGRQKMRRAMAIGGLGLALLRTGLLIAHGEYNISRLPLHLCSMAVYVIVLHALKGGRIVGQFLYAFCMPGAAAAILFPDWSYYPALSFMTLSGFAIHTVIVAYVLMQAAGGDIQPDIRLAPRCLGIMLLIALPVYVFDRVTDTNYMFLNWPAENSPLEWFSFLGRPGYLLGYIPMLAAVWTLLYFRVRLPVGHKKGRTE